MLNNPRLPQEQRVYKTKEEDPGSKALICLEQKNTVWMKDIFKKFMKPRNLVVDTCVETVSFF